MNRPIKFRAWDKSRNRMCIVRDLCFGDDGSGKTTMVRVPPPEGNSYSVYLTNGENGDLMQFTGLLDKNGREIYEGDILYVNEIFNAKVCRDDSGTWVLRNGERGGGMLAYTHDQIAVVGNIYETPDMLAEVCTECGVKNPQLGHRDYCSQDDKYGRE